MESGGVFNGASVLTLQQIVLSKNGNIDVRCDFVVLTLQQIVLSKNAIFNVIQSQKVLTLQQIVLSKNTKVGR